MKDKAITLSRRAARIRKYSAPEFNARQLEKELTHNRNNPDAGRFGAINMAHNENERVIHNGNPTGQ